MKVNHWKILSMAIGVALFSSGWAGADVLPGDHELDSVLTHAIDPAGPGFVVMAVQNGQILFCHGYGMEDREKQIPATPETRFRIGSLTKQFTAAAILRLDSQNRLSIQDHLSKYFPNFPNADRITLYQLLTHTSGIHNYIAHDDFLNRVLQPVSEDDLVSYFQNDPPDFEPGQEYKYCNSGYALLGQIIEQVTGSKLGHYFEAQFFRPLGMRDTGVYDNAKPPEHSAKGYSFANDKFEPASEWNMTWAAGAGCLYSTAGDMCRWTEALHSGHVLSLPELKTMTTEVSVHRKETLVRYCMGLYRSDLGWLPTIGHNGVLNGFSSLATWFPNQRTFIVVLSNAEPCEPGESPQDILSLAAHSILKKEMAQNAPHVDPSVDPATYPDFVGQYDYHQGIIQEISTEGGRIYAQLSGQQRFEIFPSGPGRFFYKIVEAGIVFNRDESGRVVSITHTQDGATFNALKLPDATPVPSPTPVAGH